MRKFKHQTQPTNDSCTCTCIAMLTNVPVQSVIDAYHRSYYQLGEIDTKDILDAYQIPYSQIPSGSNNCVSEGNIYILTVPSANVPLHFHHVVLDYRIPGNPLILDPAKGRDGKRYFTLNEEEADDFDEALLLPSWIVDFIIHL